MSKKFYKILSLVVCLCLIFEQIGLAQVTGSAALTTSAQLDIAGHLAGLHSSFAQDKFRPLHLRYLSYDTSRNNFSLLLDKGSAAAVENSELENAAQLLMEYFFTGLVLANESFWVNLRPDASDNIIDESLEQTDVGKVMLEADVQLKKDTARYTSPETPAGKEYWDKLYKKAGELFGSENITIPTLTRPWIVPGTIIITETEDGAYIYKATLKVMLEQDYLKDSAVYSFKDERLRALNEYSSQLIRELVIPQITQEINSLKKYAPLRQVYYSLIFAQWFKQRPLGRGGYYSQLIDTKNLTNLISKIPWSKDTYFKEYQKSFKNGEYNIKESVYTPYGQTIRSYFSGGLALAVKPEDIQSAPQEAIPQRPYLDSVDYRSTGPNAGEARTTPQRRRDNQGRFLNEEGKSPEDMVRILSDSAHRDKPFTVEQYRSLWQKVYGDELPQSIAYDDLRGALEKDWIEKVKDLPQYRLTPQGLNAAKIVKFRGWATECSNLASKLLTLIENAYKTPINERQNLYADIRKTYRELEMLTGSGLLPLGLTDNEEEAVLHELSRSLRYNLQNIAKVDFEDAIMLTQEPFASDDPYLNGLDLIIAITERFANFKLIVIERERSTWSNKLRINFDASKESSVNVLPTEAAPVAPSGPGEVAVAQVTQGEINILAERIRDIHHDLIGVLQLPIDIAHTVKEHYPNEIETVELCMRIVRLCGQLAKDSYVIRDYVVQGKKGNVEVNVRSYVETSKQLIGLFTHEQIALLKQQYAASRAGKESAQETRSHLWLFENCCKGLKLVLGTNLGLLPQERRLISLHELLDVASAIEGRPTQNIVLKRDYSPQTYYIRGDEGEFFRIFANIIRNAREAVFDFGGRIGIQTSSEADSVVIRISDSGKGMSAEKVKAFNSGQSVSSNKGESRGRGLAIVKELVNNNGGSVLAESDVDKGTTFIIRLPIVQDTPPSIQPEAALAGNSVGSINVPKSPSSMSASGMGGINFTSLPIINLTDFNFGSVSSIPMTTLNINQEFEEIQKLITANIRPSNQRIMEYLYACIHIQPSSFSLNCALSCIADILRLEE